MSKRYPHKIELLLASRTLVHDALAIASFTDHDFAELSIAAADQAGLLPHRQDALRAELKAAINDRRKRMANMFPPK